MATQMWANIGSGSGHLPDGTQLLPEHIVLPSVRSSDIHLGWISQAIPLPSFAKRNLKLAYLEFQSKSPMGQWIKQTYTVSTLLPTDYLPFIHRKITPSSSMLRQWKHLFRFAYMKRWSLISRVSVFILTTYTRVFVYIFVNTWYAWGISIVPLSVFNIESRWAKYWFIWYDQHNYWLRLAGLFIRTRFMQGTGSFDQVS